MNPQTTTRLPGRFELAALMRLTKSLEKHSPRNYGTVIGIKNGKAYVTDGFGLLRWTPNDQIGEDRVLDSNLYPSSVKYPNVEGIWPTGPKRDLDEPGQFDIFLRHIKSTNRNLYITIKHGQEPAILSHSMGEGVDGLFKRHGLTDQDKVFNLGILTRNARGLHKDAHCTKAELYADGLLKLTFDSPWGKYELLGVAIIHKP